MRFLKINILDIKYRKNSMVKYSYLVQTLLLKDNNNDKTAGFMPIKLMYDVAQ